MSELAKRVLFGIPAAAIALYITWLGGWYFQLVVMVLVMLLQNEMQKLLVKTGFKVDLLLLYSVALWIIIIPVLPSAGLIGIALFLFLVGRQVFKSDVEHRQEFFPTLFGAIYPAFGLLFVVFIRNTGNPETGFALTIAFLLMIWGNDILAYFGGKLLGRRLLAPAISPKKTWEGFLFGFIGAGLGLFLTFVLMPYTLPVSWVVLLPAIGVISVFGPLGDLTESKLKRAAKVKDTSNILPGHGGVFDRLDAIILAAPAFYLYLQCINLLGYVSF